MQFKDSIHAMMISGTPFVCALGQAYSFADYDNRARLKTAFPEIFAFYEKRFQRHRARLITEGKWHETTD